MHTVSPQNLWGISSITPYGYRNLQMADIHWGRWGQGTNATSESFLDTIISHFKFALVSSSLIWEALQGAGSASMDTNPVDKEGPSYCKNTGYML